MSVLPKFDVGLAADEALKRAAYKYTPPGRCGRAIFVALNAGGAGLRESADGCNWGPLLLRRGFKVANAGTYKHGDVMVFEAFPGNPHGHVQIYNAHRQQWVSDFRQRTAPPHAASALHWPGPRYERLRVPFVNYRYDAVT